MMDKLGHVFRNDSDKRVKIGEQYIFCYSPKKMKELYPESEFTLLGEAKTKKKEPKPPKEGKEPKPPKEPKVEKIAELNIGGQNLDVNPVSEKKDIFNKVSGYACVGERNFIALKSSIIPFIATVAGMVIALALIIALILMLLLNPKTLTPDHPMPETDKNAVDAGETGDKLATEAGGGGLSMSYTLSASIDLSKKEIAMHYGNPITSTHNASVELYIDSDGENYLIAASGTLEPGKILRKMVPHKDAPKLTEGSYTGYYVITVWDAVTGEKALIQPRINDVKITVIK